MSNEKDKFFKRLFLNPFIVEELLIHFVGEDWIKDLDFSTLEPEKTDYISKRAANRFRDLAWKIKYKGNDIYIVIHLEVQVSADNTMPIRFLEYVAYFYENKYQSLTKKDKIIPVIPILLYIGESNWNAKVKFQDLVDFKDDRLKKYIVHFEYFPIILKNISKEELVEADSILTRLLSLTKSENQKDFEYLINKLFEKVFTFQDITKRKKFKDIIKQYVEEALNINNKDKILDEIDNINVEGPMYSLSLDHIFEEDKIALAEVEKTLEKERAEKEKALEREKKAILRFHKRGFSIEELAEDFGMSIEEIKEILKKD